MCAPRTAPASTKRDSVVWSMVSVDIRVASVRNAVRLTDIIIANYYNLHNNQQKRAAPVYHNATLPAPIFEGLPTTSLVDVVVIKVYMNVVTNVIFIKARRWLASGLSYVCARHGRTPAGVSPAMS